MASKRILVFGDTAFVGSTIANYWRDHGFQFKIYELNANDRDIWYAGMNSVKLLDNSMGLLKYIAEFKEFKPDLIHIHFYHSMVGFFEHHFPDIPIIMSLHGSDLRLTEWHNMIPHTNVKLYTVSTKDLVGLMNEPDNVRLMLNAPDMSMIGDKQACGNVELEVIHSHGNLEGGKYGLYHCEGDHKINQRRDIGEIYPRISYFHFLTHFWLFHDHKIVDGKTLPLSLTAIEFLAMGGTVHHDGNHLTELPEEYNYEDIMEKWKQIYNDAIKL